MSSTTKEQFSTKKTIIILILIGVAIFGGVYSCNEYISSKNKTENESAKATLNMDLHTIVANLQKDSTFLNPYINTYIETEGAILDFTQSDYGGQMSLGIIGIHKNDSGLYVHYPLDYAAIINKKNRTACDDEKLLFKQLDNRKQASGFIYTDVEFNDQVKYDIKPLLYNSTCGKYEYDPYTTRYDLEYFTLEQIKVKGILTSVFLNKDSVYCLGMDNSLLIARKKL